MDAARKYSFVSMDSVTENCDSQSLQDRSVISDDESNDKTHEHAPKSTWLPLSMAAIEEATLPNSMNYVTSRSNPQEGFNYCEVELIRPRSYSEYGVNENGYQQSDASSSSGDIHSNERVADFRGTFFFFFLFATKSLHSCRFRKAYSDSGAVTEQLFATLAHMCVCVCVYLSKS